MMHADNNTELFTHEQTTQMTSANSGEPEDKQLSDFVDKVCDPCGFVPANLDEALAHKKKMKLLKAQDAEAAKLMESGNGVASGVDPVVGIPDDEIKNDDDDHAVDSMLAKFDLDCCPQPNNVNNSKGIAAQEDKLVSEEEFLKSEALAEDDRERSLANIAAKMNDIDLETAAEDTSDDQINDDYGGIARSGGKMQQPWYKTPAYAALIVLCGAFSIAIIVMAVLLLVNN
jgi:hypothetical protein